MSESFAHFDTFIFDEMMVHPLFFTHPNVKKIAVIHPANEGILQEILRHPQVTEIWEITNAPAKSALDARIHYFMGDEQAWLTSTTPHSFDAIISADNSAAALSETLYQQYAEALTAEGIFIHPCGSFFHVENLKTTYQRMRNAGFKDLQIFHFPQPNFPSGMRTAIMGVKHGMIKRIREKDIYNKEFTTQYYNYDTHKAALVIPEFMRMELAI